MSRLLMSIEVIEDIIDVFASKYPGVPAKDFK
jgi:hypothetical protein